MTLLYDALKVHYMNQSSFLIGLQLHRSDQFFFKKSGRSFQTFGRLRLETQYQINIDARKKKLLNTRLPYKL